VTQNSFKKEYGSKVLDGVPGTIKEGNLTANTALLKATLALDRIERHEMECSRRWGIVIRLIFLVLMKLGGLLMFLIADKLGWLS